MTPVNTETGELIDFDRAAAERRAERIRLRLDTIADNYAAVMPMIREAIDKRDDLALGYRSVGDYVSDRFGSALTNLGMEVRREVVRELTEAGLSTRAIAPVVGVSNFTVHSDQQAVRDLTPEPPATSAETRGGYASGPSLPPASVMLGTNTPQDGAGRGSNASQTPAAGSTETAPRPPVTGIDGKSYTRPEPKSPRATPRRSLPDQFFDAAYDLGKKAESIHRLISDDRFPQNAEKVAAKHRNDLLRARDLLEQVINALPGEEATR